MSSFSLHGDQLSQWRGYAAGGRGVSLGLDIRLIRPPKESGSAFAFGPCLYENEKKLSIVESTIDKLRLICTDWGTKLESDMWQSIKQGLSPKDFLVTRRDSVSQPLRDAAQALLIEMFRFTPFLKHYSFSEEAEWRVIAPLAPAKQTMTIRRFMRHGKSRLLPTVDVVLAGMGAEEMPLRKVIIGPVPEPELAADSIRLYLKWQGLENVEVISSCVPFRSW